MVHTMKEPMKSPLSRIYLVTELFGHGETEFIGQKRRVKLSLL